LKELGIDPVMIEQVLISGIPPLAGPPNYAAVLKLTERIEVSTLSPRLTEHTIPAERDDQTYWQSQHPALPSFYWVDDTTLLMAPEHTLDQLLRGQPRELDSFASELTDGSPDDLRLLINVPMIRPFIHMGFLQIAGELPSELSGILELPNQLEQIRAKINISGAGPCELSCAATDAEAAQEIDQLIEDAVTYYRKSAESQAQKLLASEDPVDQAMGRYVMRTTPIWTESYQPARADQRFTLFEIPADENVFAGATGVAVIGVLVALLLPAVQAAREAARRNSSINNMKQLMLSLLNYESTHGHFPAHANYGDDGKPLLSWRVHILPYLEEQALYDQFHLDEPWDSPHNRQLLAQMPEVFIDPSSPLATSAGRTHYLGVQGKQHVFDVSPQGRQLQQISDGMANTIMLLQVNDDAAQPWTKPVDWELDPNNSLRGLSPNLHPGIFEVAFCNGHVRHFSQSIDPETLKKFLTINGGEIANPDDW
jgi:type II secretory pathway pseudopilin PulG